MRKHTLARKCKYLPTQQKEDINFYKEQTRRQLAQLLFEELELLKEGSLVSVKLTTENEQFTDTWIEYKVCVELFYRDDAVKPTNVIGNHYD